MSESPHPDRPTGTGARPRHLRLVESLSPDSEKLEAELSLEFLDITDTSMTNDAIAKRADHMATEVITMGNLRDFPKVMYPQIIAREILENVHAQPNLDELRESVAKEAANKAALEAKGEGDEESWMVLTDLERQELQHGLAMEQRLREATSHIEHQMYAKKTQEFVEHLEDYIDEKSYANTNALRLWQAVIRRDETKRYQAPILVAGRIIKTMLLLDDDSQRPSTEPQP